MTINQQLEAMTDHQNALTIPVPRPITKRWTCIHCGGRLEAPADTAMPVPCPACGELTDSRKLAALTILVD